MQEESLPEKHPTPHRTHVSVRQGTGSPSVVPPGETEWAGLRSDVLVTLRTGAGVEKSPQKSGVRGVSCCSTRVIATPEQTSVRPVARVSGVFGGSQRATWTQGVNTSTHPTLDDGLVTPPRRRSWGSAPSKCRHSGPWTGGLGRAVWVHCPHWEYVDTRRERRGPQGCVSSLLDRVGPV